MRFQLIHAALFFAALASSAALTIPDPVQNLPRDSLIGPRQTFNQLLALIIALLPAGNPITEIFGAVTAGETLIAALQGISTTENGLQGSSCADVTLIFARGTSEPGNVGVLAGPPLFSALRTALGSKTLAVQGVDYAADVAGYLGGGDPQGTISMALYINQAFSKCPNTKVVLSGYSQGGQVVHNSAAALPASTMAKVSSVVIFGDPYSTQPVKGVSSDRTLVICHSGDDICQNGIIIPLQHLTYSQDASTAANFVKSKL